MSAQKTGTDLFQLALDEFGLYQKQGEILGFLRFTAEALPRRACEVGTWRSGTTMLLSQLLPSLSLLVGIDREIQNEERLRALAPPELQLHLLEGLSAAPETTDRLAGILAGETLDLLFIDGGHHYDAVKADFLSYRSFVRDGGLIAFHDIVLDYRTRFGATDGPWGGEVPELWRRLKASYRSVEFVDDPEQDGYGIGVIVYSGQATLRVAL